MRHATWLRVEASPFWHDLYRQYRKLPSTVRAPLRVLATPQWHLAAYLVRAASRNCVVAGPFRGTRLRLSDLSSRHLVGYILGSQELELREAVERIAEHRYGTIVNVGAADGYYTVGLALHSPASRVEAFEALPELHPVIERSARLNGVSERVIVLGACDRGGPGPRRWWSWISRAANATCSIRKRRRSRRRPISWWKPTTPSSVTSPTR